ncbi:hypothetical protein HDV00_007996 [Rhizophlyctis rosea]|nr:hypothetical protein HDV00_007996 [Rhizophlyctis rosea]
MPTLLFDETRKVQTAVQGDVLSMTVARLYHAHPNPREWTYSGKVGAVALVSDGNGGFQFVLVDLSTGRSIWNQDLSRDVKYYADRPFFHSFLGPNSMAGFSFADESDAADFHSAYLGREASSARSSVSSRPSVTSRPSTTGPPMPIMGAPAPAAPARPSVAAPAAAASPVAGLPKSASTSQVKDAGKKHQKENSGGFLGSMGKTKGKKTKGKIDKSMISAPSNFEHVSHVGYNAKTGFSAQNIPMEWKVIFAKAGITEDQLQNDRETQKVVKRFMKQHAAAGGRPPSTAEATPGAPALPPSRPSVTGPPVPPSGAGAVRRAPPPPPPSRQRAAPPPPPSRPGPTAAPAPPTPMRPQTGPPPPPPRDAYVPATPPRAPVYAQPEPEPEPYYAPAAGGPPPPPPPPPPGAGAPPPPPPPAAGGPPPPPPRAPDAGVSAGPRPPMPPMGGGDGRGSLMEAIRSAGGVGALKAGAVRESAPSPAPAPSGGASDNDLAAALRSALNDRKNALAGSDSDEDEDEDDWED